jgi:hypothetical protein
MRSSALGVVLVAVVTWPLAAAMATISSVGNALQGPLLSTGVHVTLGDAPPVPANLFGPAQTNTRYVTDFAIHCHTS